MAPSQDAGIALGLGVAIVGGLAAAQLVYRMFVAPFGCLTYSACGTTAKADVTLLAGIWIGLTGCGLALLGGLGHTFSSAARRTLAAPVIAERQTGMTPWLGIAGVAMVVAFVAPFTFFKAYRVEGFLGGSSSTTWGGWLSVPHTSSLVLAAATIGLVLIIAAARRRSLLTPSALGATIGVLGFVIASRELFRILQSPFSSAGGSDTPVGGVTILAPFWIGFAAASIVCVAAVVQVLYREKITDESRAPSTAVRHPQTGATA